MTETANSFQAQQLLELLAVVSSYPDEGSAMQGAVERAAQALEAEVAAVVVDGRVTACVGFPAGAVPHADLVAAARRDRDFLDVPGMGRCPAVSTGWDGPHLGSLVLARWEESFSVEEHNLVRGMARVLELVLTMLRTLQAEHAMRERSERQAAENAELLTTLRQRQHLLERLFDVQRAISHRQPLAQILGMITRVAQDLLGAETVGLWLRDTQDAERAELAAAVGPRGDIVRSRSAVPLSEAGAAGAAMRADDIVVCHGDTPAATLITQLTDSTLGASMPAPVHDNGTVTGSLLVGSSRPERSLAAQGDPVHHVRELVGFLLDRDRPGQCCGGHRLTPDCSRGPGTASTAARSRDESGCT